MKQGISVPGAASACRKALTTLAVLALVCAAAPASALPQQQIYPRPDESRDQCYI